MTPKNLLRRGTLAALATAAALLLGACGGGVESDDFVARRVIAFGDESSVLDDAGSPGNARKYSINAVDDDDPTKRLCANNPLWVQALATAYGLVFAECNPDDVEQPAALMQAEAGLRVAGVRARIDAFIAGGQPRADDLAAVLVGVHDVLDIYAAWKAGTLDADGAVAAAEDAGRRLGDAVNTLAAAGPKVLVATIPKLGQTPFAAAEDEAAGNAAASTLLTRLSERFNARMRTTLPPDGGRSIGLVLYDETVSALVRRPSTYDVVDARACDPVQAADLRDCTQETLLEDAEVATYLWADDLWPAPALQNRLGTLAVRQARRNPF